MVEGGLSLYVEPNAFAASEGGNVLLVGSPTFLIGRDSSGHGTPPVVDSVMGAVIRPDGTAHTVPFPIPSHVVGYVNALGRDDGGWDVAFAELRSGWSKATHSRTDSITRLWHGVYDGERWKSVEVLPSPPDSMARLHMATTLTRYGDSLAWAVTGSTNASYFATVVYELRGSGWSYELVPGASFPTYLALGSDSASGLQLAVTGADFSLPRPSQYSSSVVLWQQRPSWHVARRVPRTGGEEAAHEPIFGTWAHHTLLTWAAETMEEGLELRALVDPLSPTSTASVITGDVPFMSNLAALCTQKGVPLWITNYTAARGGPDQVRFHTISRGGGLMIGAITPPYERGFSAAAATGTGVLLTGVSWDRANAVVVSTLVSVDVVCRAGT